MYPTSTNASTTMTMIVIEADCDEAARGRVLVDHLARDAFVVVACVGGDRFAVAEAFVFSWLGHAPVE
jgi:hypothetical protein